MIEVKQLVKRAGSKVILDGVSLHVHKGQMVGIIGPNGAGKSTLLHILSGVDGFDHGEVSLQGKPIGSYSRKALAKWLAVLQQEGLPTATFSVREVIRMGRFPFQNWLGDETEDAEALVEQVLALMDLTVLGERRLDQLSGGERQRVALAKVMVQEPKLIYLDEPTTFLDIGYQVQLLDAVKDWQSSQGLTVLAVLHDLNLAAQYCDRLLVLHNGRIAAQGTPAEVLTADCIREVYGTEAIILTHPANGCPQVLLKPQRGGER